VLGLSLLLFYKLIGGMPDFLGLAIAHTILGIPFVIRSVSASLLTVDPVLEEASQSLRAGPWRTFALILMPLIWPGILSGAMFAFIVSFGELNTALFLTRPRRDDSPDRDLQLPAIPRRPAGDRRRLGRAGRHDRADRVAGRAHGRSHPSDTV
jgi:ABC-type glycerol-3-phosphate transport system permease component